MNKKSKLHLTMVGFHILNLMGFVSLFLAGFFCDWGVETLKIIGVLHTIIVVSLAGIEFSLKNVHFKPESNKISKPVDPNNKVKVSKKQAKINILVNEIAETEDNISMLDKQMKANQNNVLAVLDLREKKKELEYDLRCLQIQLSKLTK